MPTLAYCATLNNYTTDEVAQLRNGHEFVSYLIAGHEIAPTTGTPHLQIYFQLDKQIRFSTIKKWDGAWARMKFLQSRGSDDDNYRYCSKDGSFFEIGTRRNMPGKGARTDLNDLKKAIDDGKTFDTICDEHFDHCSKYWKFIQNRIVARAKKTELHSLLGEFENVSWKPWQKHLNDICEQEPDDRKIMWIWEGTGNVGKTFWSNWMMATGKATLIEMGKKSDLAYILAQDLKPVVIIDLTRTTEDHMGSLYSLGAVSYTHLTLPTILRV